MQRLIIAFTMLFVISCTPAPTSIPEHPTSTSSPEPPTPISSPIPIPPTLLSSSGVPIKAIYLVQEGGQLSQEDLQAHPEVIATNNFEEFKNLAKSKVALWIDINSMGLVDLGWLGTSPQMFYPVVVVGNSNDTCVFFEQMLYFLFEVPPPDPEDKDYCDPRPGFSINQLRDESGGRSHGYEESPTVQGILDRTDSLWK